MARNNTFSATFSQAAGDGANGFSEASGNRSFVSGDAVKIEGSVGLSVVQYSTASFGFAQADGIYFENRDTTNFITLTLQTGAAADFAAIKIAPNGVFCVRFDASQAPITHISVLANLAICNFVMCLAE
jgi:hypothetical protein